MSIIPADQARTLTPPPSRQETRRQIRQARRQARADAAEKRSRSSFASHEPPRASRRHRGET